MEEITYEKIKPYIENKLISQDIHPADHDVRIFNYTQKAQFNKVWDDITMQCRGLIMNIRTGEILARPFPKFFNYQELVAKGEKIPEEQPIITEKMDGSLGILYELNGKYRIATRGAFESEQAIWATRWLNENEEILIKLMPKKYTYLFEIIYPKNRIVVNYDFSGLVLIAVRHTESGAEVIVYRDFLQGLVRMPKEIPPTDLEMLSKMDNPNSEGFVIFYRNNNLRLKIKFPEYVRLHKLVTGVSEIAIWEHLKEGKNLDELLDKVPDEFFQWVKAVEGRLSASFSILWAEAVQAERFVSEMEGRKEQALWIMQNAKRVSGVVFSLLDNDKKRAIDSIWKIVRPSGSSKYKADIDQ